MDPLFFDVQAAHSLGDWITSPGQNGTTFPAVARRSFILRAVDAYSYLNPIIRPWGQGNIYAYETVPVGEDGLYAMGGPWVSTDQIIIDPNLPTAETLTVLTSTPTSIWSQTQPRLQAATHSLPLTQLTFTTPTVNAHGPDSIIVKVTPGLMLIANQGVYYTSNDFRDIEHNTFDIAFGLKPTGKRLPGYWDASLSLEAAYSGLSWAEMSDYSVGGSGYSTWFGANPDAFGPNGPVPNCFQEQIIRIVRSEPQTIVFIPPPTQPQNTVFEYFSNHTVSSVPSADSDGLLAYVEYSAWEAQAAAVQVPTDQKIGEYQTRPSLNAAQYRGMAQEALKRFYDRFRNKPIMRIG